MVGSAIASLPRVIRYDPDGETVNTYRGLFWINSTVIQPPGLWFEPRIVEAGKPIQWYLHFMTAFGRGVIGRRLDFETLQALTGVFGGLSPQLNQMLPAGAAVDFLHRRDVAGEPFGLGRPDFAAAVLFLDS